MVTWLLEADVRRNQTYSVNLTSFLVRATWSHGCQSQDEFVAQPARMTLSLDNTGGEFTPDTLFSEKLTNGSFATWSGGNPSSWTVSSESAGTREVSQVGADKAYGGGGTGACNIYNTTTTAISITQSVLTASRPYRVQITVSKVTAGGIAVTAGGIAVGAAVITQAGVYTYYVWGGGTDFKIESYRINGTCDVTIDTVSVMQTAQYGRLLSPGTLIRLKANGTTMFIGAVAAENGTNVTINKRTGRVDDQMMTLVVEDYMLKLLDAEYAPPLMTDTTTGAVLQKLFDDGVIIAPYPADYAMLDVQYSNMLDTTPCQLWDSADIATLDTGDTALDFAGDTSDKGKGVSAQGYLREMVEAEAGGRFFYNARTGKFNFKQRTDFIYQGTLAATFTETFFREVEYVYGDMLFNAITVNYSDRETGAAETVLWTNRDVPFKLGVGQRKNFTAKYTTTASDKARVAGKDFLLPFPGVDYTANSEQNGSGADKTGLLTVSIQHGAMSAKVYVENASKEEIWVQSLQFRGTPLINYDVSLDLRDGDSMALYGTMPKTVNLKALADANFVEQYAAWMLGKYKTPFARFASITYNARTPSTNETTATSRAIGDFIRITESNADHDQTYVIIGESHTIDAGTGQWDVTYRLLQTNRERYTLLDVAGTDELDTNAKLGL